jgi:hypothetical protein
MLIIAVMERLTPNTLTGAFDKAYLGNLTQQVNYITSKGAYAMIQPHNYGRFYGNIITDTAGFKTWWKNVAAQYKDNALVVFDTNNEYHDMDQTLVFNLNQASIDGIRAAGATKQYITPEGNSYTGAWTWISSGNGASLINLKDPQNKLIYQMHQYLDSDGSGTSTTCVSATIFKERLQAATRSRVSLANMLVETTLSASQRFRTVSPTWRRTAMSGLVRFGGLLGRGGATIFTTWSRALVLRGLTFCLRSSLTLSRR